MAALEWLAAGAAAGDSLVFSFSGHGAPGFARGHALLPCDFSKVREAAGRSGQAVHSCAATEGLWQLRCVTGRAHCDAPVNVTLRLAFFSVMATFSPSQQACTMLRRGCPAHALS